MSIKEAVSPSSRRAWIEICRTTERRSNCGSVALLAEGVDRNFKQVVYHVFDCPVALLAEGVDRNFCTSCSALTGSCVALLAEGVDRNSSAVGRVMS